MNMFASEEPKATTAAHLFGMFCQESSSKTQARAQGGDDLDKLWTMMYSDIRSKHTPRKTNMSPENQWLEDVFRIKIVLFEGV